MFKTADGKAATSESSQAWTFSPAHPELPEQLFPGPYVETLSEARTKLAARFQHPSRSVGL